MKKFYLTTPLYYVNDNLHLGHSYTTIAADVLARFKRLQGYEVHFLTGTDEHGQKIEKAAQQQNVTPQELADKVVGNSKDLWKNLNISYTDFIRTTEERHIDGVQSILSKLFATGDIYKSKYEGWYCLPCESYWLEKELIENNCPQCKRPVERLTEDGYSFKLSKYQDKLLKHIEANPDFICPTSRYNEIINRVKDGLQDVCISRSNFSWGIPIPNDPKYVTWVWIDALSNYITAIGFPDKDKVNNCWPADVHIMAKDIIWFHAVIWPAMLMALDLPLPKKVFAHGWWTVEGDKMSKSKGNVVDPNEMIKNFGVDAYRFFVLREVPFGLDGDFSQKAMIDRINSELANDLGNLLSRTLKMVEKFCDAKIPEIKIESVGPLQDRAKELTAKIPVLMDELKFQQILVEIWTLISLANKYIDDSAPWKLSKDPANKPKIDIILYNLMESLRITAVFINPFMPKTSEIILNQLGNIKIDKDFAGSCEWGQLKPGAAITKGENLFPRIVTK